MFMYNILIFVIALNGKQPKFYKRRKDKQIVTYSYNGLATSAMNRDKKIILQ